MYGSNQYTSYHDKQQQQHYPLFEDISSPQQSYNVPEGSNVSARRPPQVMDPGTGTGSPMNNFPGSQFMQDPLVSNMAMQYGHNLMGQGRQFVDSKIEKYMSVTKLKYYFAVDTNYVLMKIKLLFFSFNHKDWSVKYDHDEPVQPKHDLNAPDLYIPLMSFITYILLYGFYLGLQNRFSPDILGMQASCAVIWLVLELIVMLIMFHVASIHTRFHPLHLLALVSYKYFGIVVTLMGGLFLNMFGYYCLLGYSSAAIVVFLFCTLRCHILGGSSDVSDYTSGNKKRFYLLVIVSALQPIMMWALTWHLVSFTPVEVQPPITHYPY